MIVKVDTIDHNLAKYIADDPVRPEIAISDRLGDSSRFVLILVESSVPQAVVCIRLCDRIPRSVYELLSSSSGSIAVFYSIWSYSRGSGRQLLISARDYINQNHSEVNQYYTLSPHGESVERFHLGLGASIYRTNDSTVNYSYPGF